MRPEAAGIVLLENRDINASSAIVSKTQHLISGQRIIVHPGRNQRKLWRRREAWRET